MDKVTKLLESLGEEELAQLIQFMETVKEKKNPSAKTHKTHNIKERGLSRRQRKKQKSKPTDSEKLEDIRKERRKSKKTKGSAGRKESIDTSGNRPNLFETMKFSRNEKRELDKDREIDQKLQKDWTPTDRDRMSELVVVICRECGEEETINISMCPQDVSRYKCNECSKAGG